MLHSQDPRRTIDERPASVPHVLLSNAAERIGSERFGVALLDGLRAAVEVDFIAVVTRRPEEGFRTSAVASRRDPYDALGLTQAYVTRGHVHDPNRLRFKGLGACRKPLFLRHDEKQLTEPDYRQHFFTRPGIIDKLSYLWSAGNTAFYVNLYRLRETGAFTDGEVEHLDRMSSMLVDIIRHHDVRSRLDEAMATGNQCIIAAHLVGMLDAGLTPREEAVLSRIVSGITTEGIALHLGVKRSTVITLRKRGYAKLGIATQAELFGRCLQVLPKAYARPGLH